MKYRRGNYIFEAAGDSEAESRKVCLAYRGWPLSRLDGEAWIARRGSTAEEAGLSVAEDMGIVSRKGSRALNEVRVVLGRRRGHTRNNEGANYQAIASLCSDAFGGGEELAWTHGAPRDSRLASIPTAER